MCDRIVRELLRRAIGGVWDARSVPLT